MAQDEEPGPAEITQPLPAVEPAPAGQPAARPGIDEPTTALPLIDLLAPRPIGPQPPLPPAAAPPPGTPGVAQSPFVGPPHHPGPGQGQPTMFGPGAGPVATARRPGRFGWPLIAVIAGGALLIGLLGWLAVDSAPPREQAAITSTVPTTPIRVAGNYQFIERATRTDTDCAGSSYGQVAGFFRSSPCTRLQRDLYTSSVGGRPVVVSVASVQMPDERAAAALRKLADTNGTGNVSDLLRAGVRVPGVPDGLSGASYASAQMGSMVVIVESDYTDPGQRADVELERLSDAALQLGKGG